MSVAPINSYDYHFNVLLVGNSNVGKTSIAKKTVKDEFSYECSGTDGVDFEHKTYSIGEHQVRVTFFDTSGHQRYQEGVAYHYYKACKGAFVVTALPDLQRDSEQVFTDLEKWVTEIRNRAKIQNKGKEVPVPIVLLVNKYDIGSLDEDDRKTLQAFQEKHNIQAWYPTSAKDGATIETAIEHLVSEILKCHQSFVDGEEKEPEPHTPSLFQSFVDGGEKGSEPREFCQLM